MKHSQLRLLLAAVASAVPAEAPSGFAGARRCPECHDEVHAHWSGTSHARTLLPATPDVVPADVRKGWFDYTSLMFGKTGAGVGEAPVIRTGAGAALAKLAAGPDAPRTPSSAGTRWAGWPAGGAARQLAGDLDGAIAAYERKLELDPCARLVRAAVERLRRQRADRSR